MLIRCQLRKNDIKKKKKGKEERKEKKHIDCQFFLKALPTSILDRQQSSNSQPLGPASKQLQGRSAGPISRF
ncbi:hypothetical protein TgHK011_006198 [Trichoderma gracile]|nr:hypothetical protein TgHK011_006198 [Trichoderma gracile]